MDKLLNEAILSTQFSQAEYGQLKALIYMLDNVFPDNRTGTTTVHKTFGQMKG